MNRKCGTCFRFREDWRDAKKRGLEPRFTFRLDEYEKKPRRGVKCCCSSAHIHHEPKASDKACKHHQYRCTWNIRIWWDWHFKYELGRLVYKYINRPIGRLRKPLPLQWKDSFDGCRDIIIPNAEPVCPHCGEMPYSYTECQFCGQRFVQDEKTKEESKPPKVERLDCLMCGKPNAVVGTRAKTNGHFHGQCEECGAVYGQ